MRITTASIFVDDQQKALDFYTTKLGFQLKTDVPAGPFRWLTVVSPAEPDGVELLLEPSEHPAVAPFMQALVEDGIPWTSFGVEDCRAEHERGQRTGGWTVREEARHGCTSVPVSSAHPNRHACAVSWPGFGEVCPSG